MPKPRLAAAVFRRLSLLVFTVLVAGLFASVLVRLAPGVGFDERQMDLRLTSDSLAALDSGARTGGVLADFRQYLADLVRGDWGVSLSLHRPVRELVRERAPTTIFALTSALALSWAASWTACLVLQWSSRGSLNVAATVLTGFLLCLPAAVVALLFLYLNGPPSLALAVILFPRIFGYQRSILEAGVRRQHVLAAQARGVGPLVLFWRHVARPAAPEILALAGVSVSTGLGAVIPVEALCDSPGVGQLVWQAALARDLPVLMHLTVLVAIVTCAANLVTDAVTTAGGPA
jgi:peptide/nickel transport system permease protein